MYDSNLFSAILNLVYFDEVLRPDPIPCYAEKICVPSFPLLWRALFIHTLIYYPLDDLTVN